MNLKPSQIERDAAWDVVYEELDTQGLENAKAGVTRLERTRRSTGLAERNGQLATIPIYGTFVRRVTRSGEISGSSIVAAIRENFDAQALYFRISSEGGSTSALDEAKASLRLYRGRSIAVIDHFANSAAAEFAIACDRVVIRRNASMMFHRMSAGLAGNCDQLRDYARSMSMRDSISLRSILSRVPVRHRDAVRLAYERETHLSAEQALEYRLADAIAPALLNSDELVHTTTENQDDQQGIA
jgi:ATP-dependent protease ClpP protease subunit